MKVYLLIGTLLLACGSILAQSSSSSQSGAQSGDMSSKMQMGSGQQSHDKAAMQAHMKQMQADMQQMKTSVEKMRADAQKVQDPNTKAVLLENADMWEQFISRMDAHMGMMREATPRHEGMMPGKGMKHKTGPPQTAQPSEPTPK